MIALEEKVKLQALLHNAILKLNEGEIEEAVSLLSKGRREIISQISLGVMNSDVYHLLCQVSSLIYLAMLHYFALAQKEGGSLDNVAKLTYLSQSLGISNILDGVLFPLLMTKDFAEKGDFVSLVQLGDKYKEELCRDVGTLIDRLRTNDGDKKKELAESVKKIIEAVNPNSPEVRNLAIQLTRRFEAGDFKQARKIYEYVRDDIHYMRDPLHFEDIQSPEVTLERFSGDCEDQSILLCSLLLAIGFETALIFADTDGDDLADHVYTAVHIPGAPELYKPFLNKKFRGKNLRDWIPLDPTSEDADFGIIPFENLEITEIFSFSKDGQYFFNERV